MTQGPIQRMALERRESQAHLRLETAWIAKTPDLPSPQSTAPSERRGEATSRTAEGPVLVMLGTQSDAARELALACATSSARIYVLVGPTGEKDQLDERMLRAPRVLVRRIPEVPVSMVHTAMSARIWIGGGRQLHLDPSQSEALRHLFLRMFWHEASGETWSGGQRFEWRAAAERPFDVPAPRIDAPVLWDRPEASLADAAHGDASLHLTAGEPPKIPPRRLWFPAGPNHHHRLAELARAGVAIQWEDRGLPDMITGGDAGEILLAGSLGRLRVRLNRDQVSEVAKLLEVEPRWRFHRDVDKSAPELRRASFWMAGKAASPLEEEQLIEMQDVLATSLRALPDTAPRSMPTGQPLALGVCYRWTALPPSLPAGAVEDDLIIRWRKRDEDWTARLARTRQALEACTGDRTRIGTLFQRLKRELLGFERTNGELLAALATLEKQRPSSAGPANAPDLIARLAELEDRAQRLKSELTESEHKAREDEDREQQQASWQQGVDTANRDLPKKKSELDEVEQRHIQLTSELRALEEQLESADPKTKHDLKARQHRLSDDRRKVGKNRSQLHYELGRLEKEAASKFEFRTSVSRPKGQAPVGNRFIPPAANHAKPDDELPGEALPEVGKLHTKKGGRFLVIDRWEDLELGERAAARLSAALVTAENA